MSWPTHTDGRTMPMVMAENSAFREVLATIAHRFIRKDSAEEMQAQALEVLARFRYDPKPDGSGCMLPPANEVAQLEPAP